MPWKKPNLMIWWMADFVIEKYRIVRWIKSSLLGSQIQTLRKLTESDPSRGSASKQDTRIFCICAQDDFESAAALNLDTDLTEQVSSRGCNT